MVTKAKKTKSKKKPLSTLKSFPLEQVKSVKILTASLRKVSHYKTWREALIDQIPNGYSWKNKPSLEEVLKILSEEVITSFVLKALKSGEDKKNLPILLGIEDPKFLVKVWPPKNARGETDFQKLEREIGRYCKMLEGARKVPLLQRNPEILREIKTALDTYHAFQDFIRQRGLRKNLTGKFLKDKTDIYFKILNSEQLHPRENPLFSPDPGEMTKRIVQRLYPYLKGILSIPDWINYPDGEVNEEGEEMPPKEKIPFLDSAISNLFQGKITPQKVRDLYDPQLILNYGTY